jgi:hypothetical protein
VRSSRSNKRDGKRIDERVLKQLKITGSAAVSKNLHHTALRIYTPEVRQLAFADPEVRAVIEQSDFKEYRIFNINTPEDLLAANLFVLRRKCLKNYIAGSAKIRRSRITRSSIYDKLQSLQQPDLGLNYFFGDRDKGHTNRKCCDRWRLPDK